MLRVLRGAAFIYVVYAGAMVLLQRWLLFPTWAVPRDPAPASASLEPWKHEFAGGAVEAWLLPAAAAPAPALVFFHGNGERTDDWLGLLEAFRAQGMHVLVVEYRGYNRSAGAPSKEALLEDSAAFVARLEADPRVDRARIAYYGRSLGGAVASGLLERHPPSALILQSTFTSVAAVAATRGLPALFVRDPFDSLEAVRRLKAPLLVGHGNDDEVIPYSHGVALAEAGRGTLVTYDCGHNNFPPSWNDWVGETSRFLEAAWGRDGGVGAVSP